MHIIKQTIVTTESWCLKELLWSHLKVRNICHSTEDLLESLWTIRIEKNMKKKMVQKDIQESLFQIMKCNSIIVVYIITVVAHWSMITAVSITLRVKKLVWVIISKTSTHKIVKYIPLEYLFHLQFKTILLFTKGKEFAMEIHLNTS